VDNPFEKGLLDFKHPVLENKQNKGGMEIQVKSPRQHSGYRKEGQDKIKKSLMGPKNIFRLAPQSL
jgi:hypothetical protein